jgi:hypothetical protein
MATKTSYFVSHAARFALFCRFAAKIGGGSEKATKTSYFVSHSARFALLCRFAAKIGGTYHITKVAAG